MPEDRFGQQFYVSRAAHVSRDDGGYREILCNSKDGILIVGRVYLKPDSSVIDSKPVEVVYNPGNMTQLEKANEFREILEQKGIIFTAPSFDELAEGIREAAEKKILKIENSLRRKLASLENAVAD